MKEESRILTSPQEPKKPGRIDQLKRFITAFSRRREAVVLSIIIVLYSAIMSYLTIVRMHVLHSSAWDLGNYNQALFTFTHNGMLFYWTADLPQNPGGSLFGGHFSPILALIAPVYLLYPLPETLLIIQSVLIGLGAVPVWLIAKNVLRMSSLSLRLALASLYLVQPALLGLNWFDFHPEAFIPVLYLTAAYYLMRRDFKRGIVFSTLLLATIEYAPLMLILLALTLAAPEVVKLVRRRFDQDSVRTLFPWLAVVALSLAWLYLAISVIRLFNPHDPTTSGVSSSWMTLGADNLLQVPIRVILSPGDAVRALFTDALPKAGFLLIIAIPFALFPLLSPRFWVLASPWVIPALLSNEPGYYSLGLQYPAFIFPPMVLAFLYQLQHATVRSSGTSVSRWEKIRSHLEDVRQKIPRVDLRILLVVCTLVGLTLSNPLGSFLVATTPWANYGLPQATDKSITTSQLLGLIPTSASVLTDFYIFPLVSSRPNAFTWPYVINYPTIPFLQYIQRMVNESKYVLLDLTQFQPYNAVILSFCGGYFGVLAYSNGLLLLERDYSGLPVVYQAYTQSFSYRDLRLVSGRIVDDTNSSYGKVLQSDGVAGSHNFWVGPNVMLPPGEYSVSYRVKVSSSSNGQIVALRTVTHEVAVIYQLTKIGRATLQELTSSPANSTSQTISNLNVTSTMLSSGTYHDFVQNIRADSFSYYDFRGENVSSPIVSLDKIEIIETKPLPTYGTVKIEYGNGLSSLPESTPNLTNHTLHLSRTHSVELILGEDFQKSVQSDAGKGSGIANEPVVDNP